MLRFLRILFIAVLGIILVAIAVANRAPVTLRALPAEIDTFAETGWSIEVPLFIAIFGGIVLGLAIGFVLEWLREAKHRTAAVENRRQAGKLEREVERLRGKSGAPDDEVIALLEGRSSVR